MPARTGASLANIMNVSNGAARSPSGVGRYSSDDYQQITSGEQRRAAVRSVGPNARARPVAAARVRRSRRSRIALIGRERPSGDCATSRRTMLCSASPKDPRIRPSRPVNDPRHARQPTRTARPRAKWREWVVLYTFVTVLWPALGPLPWMVANDAPRHAHAVLHEHGHESAEHAHHSDVPGSPTHPADHDCAACQVLHCLAHCVVALHESPRVAVQVVLATAHWLPSQPPTVFAVTPPQPARGPPARLA